MEKLKEYLFYPLLLIVAVVALYQNVVNNEFSGLDDQLMLVENWDKLTQPSHALLAFTDDVFAKEKGSYYRPVQVLSYIPDALIIQSEEPSPRIFFIVNIILFALNLVLVFWFLGLFGFSQVYRSIFAILYLLHPALTPGVAWIPGRVDVVLTILGIMSLWSFIKYLSSKKLSWLIVHLLFFALGLFNKETSIVIPVVALTLAIYFSPEFNKVNHLSWKEIFGKKFILEMFQYIKKWLVSNLTISIGWVVIIIIWYIMRKLALHDDQFSLLGILKQIAFSWVDLIILTGATIIPFQLQVYLEITPISVLMAIPGALIFFLLPFKLHTSKKNLILGWAWFLFFIYPTTLADLINYHRLALPIIGMAFILAPLDQFRIGKTTSKTVLVIIGYAVFLLAQNIQFQEAFLNAKSFWINAQTNSPKDPMANNGLAWSYHIEHENDSAYKYYEKVILLDTLNQNTRISMALILEEQGRTKQCDSLLQAEFKVTKDSNFVFYYIGQILLERGDTIEAIDNLNKGFLVTPSYRNARQYYDTLDIKVQQKLNLKTP